MPEYQLNKITHANNTAEKASGSADGVRKLPAVAAFSVNAYNSKGTKKENEEKKEEKIQPMQFKPLSVNTTTPDARITPFSEKKRTPDERLVADPVQRFVPAKTNNEGKNEEPVKVIIPFKPAIQFAKKKPKKKTAKEKETEMDAVAASKGKMGHRTTTAYGYFNLAGKKRQGPHTLAHVSHEAFFAVISKLEYDYSQLLGSAAMPRPTRVNRMIKERLQERGVNWEAETKEARLKYLRQYMKLYKGAQEDDHPKFIQAIVKGIELSPAAGYNLAEGRSTADQIAGKAEKRGRSIKDLKAIIKSVQQNKGLPKNLLTIDVDSIANAKELKQVWNMIMSYGKLLNDQHVDTDDGSSDSDADGMDLRTGITKGIPSAKKAAIKKAAKKSAKSPARKTAAAKSPAKKKAAKKVPTKATARAAFVKAVKKAAKKRALKKIIKAKIKTKPKTKAPIKK